MSVFNLLTEEDKDKIIQYIVSFGPITDDTKTPTIRDVETVLDEWNRQKNQHLEKLFGGNKLILNRPYTYTMSAEGVAQEIAEAINEDTNDIYYPMRDWISFIIRNRAAVRFVEQINTYLFVRDLFEPAALADNAYKGENVRISFKDDEIFKITKGMKVMKIIKKIVEKCGDEETFKMYEDFRQWHSMLLNQIHLDGTLSLSIHPLDYMTMSDNGGSWDSCMRWQETAGDHPGDYRIGTVVCMNSPYIVVAYLHNPKKTMDFWNPNTHQNDYHWNKKKWRELFIVQDGIISEIKGYPFQDENLTNTTLMWLKELAAENLGWTYDDVEIDIAHETDREDEIATFRFDSGMMYNDLGSLPKHCGRVNFKTLEIRGLDDEDEDVKLTDYYTANSDIRHRIYELVYGGVPTCMCCGRENDAYDDRSNSVFCSRCEPIQACPCCGEYLNGEGYYVSAYEDPICFSCYDYECGTDELSEDRELNESLVDIWLVIGKDKDGNIVKYRDPIYTLNPEEYTNAEYDRIFNKLPKCENYSKNGWIYSFDRYVTYDMAKNIGDIEDIYDIDMSSPEGIVDIMEEYPECKEWFLPMEHMQMALDMIKDETD